MLNYIFLNLEFLNTQYIEFLKWLSFYVMVGFMIIFGLGVLVYFFQKDKKNNFISESLKVLIVLITIFTILATFVLFIGFMFFPACYISAMIKDLLMAKYIINPELLTTTRDITINLFSIIMGAGAYSYILGIAFKNFINNETETIE